MTFLKIFLSLNILFFFLSMASVRLRFSYYNKLGLKISYLCFSYTAFPRKEKKKARKKPPEKTAEKKEKEKKENVFQRVYREEGLSGLLHLLKALADMAGGALKKLFQHIRAKRLSLHVSVAEGDAATTAIHYGYVCSAVYPAFSVITQAMKCSSFEVAVVPDFHGKETKIQGAADVKIRVLFLLTIALQALIRYMKLIKTAKIDNETNNKKGGAVNEQQSSD
ncbi:MAG: DUF2953 domain-containing protein [Oscillospiraceae bacterium]|jgi:Ca2+/Na+ antiporter|nr:DUF2953 domain-containing protein [Oscillospiraceae bacterium]